MKNFYEILGVREDATAREIRDAYRREAKKWHPDVNRGIDFKLCHQMMCDINEAYRYLISPELRKVYDELLAEKRKEAIKKSANKVKTGNVNDPKSPNISKEDFNYYDIEDYDEYEKEEFTNWLYDYYKQVINLFTGFITLEELEKLVQGFENILNYEKRLLSRKRKNKNR